MPATSVASTSAYEVHRYREVVAPVWSLSVAAYGELDLDIHDTDLDGTPYDLGTQIHQEQRQRQLSQK